MSSMDDPVLRELAAMNLDELSAWLDSLRYVETTPEESARLLASLPEVDPDAPVVVVPPIPRAA